MHKETVTIQKLVNGGFGLAYLPSNQVILVQFALPGENITVTTEESNKNYLFGKVVQIEKEHPARIQAPCEYYSRCGGCNLQHCDLATQARLKREIVVDLLRRGASFTIGDIDNIVQPTIAAPAPYHYRQRIRLQVGKDCAIGFHRYRSNDIVEVSQCLLAAGPINEALGAIRENEEIRPLIELAEELELQLNPSTDLVSCIFHLKRKPRPADYNRAKSLVVSTPSVDRVFFSGDNFPMEGPVREDAQPASNLLNLHYESVSGLAGGLQLSWEVGGFCQVNLAQNKKMIETVLRLSGAEKNDSVLDLYCGMGNFAIPLSQLAGSVLGYEGQGASIRCARENSRTGSPNNSTFIKQAVHKACDELIEEKTSFDIVIVDPPRQGVPGLGKSLSNLCKKRLVYISCDPATLCRDLGALAAEGFNIVTIQPIDMFPQTHHIETVVLLEK